MDYNQELENLENILSELKEIKDIPSSFDFSILNKTTGTSLRMFETTSISCVNLLNFLNNSEASEVKTEFIRNCSNSIIICVEKSSTPTISVILVDNVGHGIVVSSTKDNTDSLYKVHSILESLSEDLSTTNDKLNNISETIASNMVDDVKAEVISQVVEDITESNLDQYIMNQVQEKVPEAIQSYISGKAGQIDSNTESIVNLDLRLNRIDTRINNLDNDVVSELGYNGKVDIQHSTKFKSILQEAARKESFRLSENLTKHVEVDHPNLVLNNIMSVVNQSKNGNKKNLDNKLTYSLNYILTRLYNNNYYSNSDTHKTEDLWNDNLDNPNSIKYLAGTENLMYAINNRMSKIEESIEKVKAFLRWYIYTIYDINEDNDIDISDTTKIISDMAGEYSEEEIRSMKSDVNKDRKIDQKDIDMIIKLMANIGNIK